MYDSRLIGTWRSDARRTASEIAVRRDLTPSRKKKLRQFFGKMVLRYTPTRCFSHLNGQVSVNRYIVVAKDSSSVALLVSNAIMGDHIVHVHFEGSHYWIILGSGRMREFFRRVAPKPAKQDKRRVKS